LLAEGYLVAQGGSATRVATLPRSRPATASPAPVAAPAPRPIVAFSSGVPDLGSAPRDDWAWAVREACRLVPNQAWDYGDPAGDSHLRDVVAGYLRRVRAADTTAANTVICAGFQQGLTLVLEALSAAGVTRVAHETPGSWGTIERAARAAGLAAVPVPVDEQGIVVDELASSGAGAVVLTPAHQWPTGVVLSAERRRALMEWATETDAVVIEDEYDAEFRYDREPVGSLQGLSPDRVIILGTVSKSLAPALRLGWAVVPDRLVAAVIAAKQLADRGNPGLDQAALALLIESGRYDRHLRRMRAEYSRRRDALVRALGHAAPELRVSGLSAGIHAVVHLPDAVSEPDLVRRARERGLVLEGMSLFSPEHVTDPPRLVIGFGNTPVESIEEGVRMLAELLQQ
jgi:GntR family transcriptional regulator/MocR family aminotransferase